MIVEEDNYLAHYGILRRSGRYPWGSGGPEYASSESFLGYVAQLQKQGLSEKDIAAGFGTTTTQLRAAKSIAKAEKKAADIALAQRLQAKGYSNGAIAERMSLPGESSVRSLLAQANAQKVDIIKTTGDMLRSQVDQKGYIDIGKGVENHLGVTRNKLDASIAMLREEGYKMHYVQVEQLGTGKKTTIKVLGKPDSPYPQIKKNPDIIKPIQDFSVDGGRTYLGIHPPINIDSKRVAVRYGPDGGSKEDGVIYVRPGVKDLSMGNSRYAQVRIAVDGTHYLKGMAVYRDDLPKGVDLMFNTNKKDTGNKLDAMKKMEADPDNPFGSVIRQRVEVGPDGKERVTSALNIIGSKPGSYEQGGWDAWSRALSSQFLSKQSPSLAREQLGMNLERKKNELAEIMRITNPTVRKKLLEGFADDADSSAVHLKAAALPRQANRVILPLNSLKENEVYAPGFHTGEKVVLVRHPHGGTFEIPELTVNNRHPEAKRLFGADLNFDAVVINAKVAERLSGADFDGDSVLVIPNNHGKVTHTRPLEGLKDFDPKDAYPGYPGMKKMSEQYKGKAMGDISNLITDMSIKKASPVELAAAVRHSMVVIDAAKHGLNYKESYRANNIAHLKEKYQSRPEAPTSRGASTLISRASAETRVNERKQGYSIDPVSGRKVYRETGAVMPDKKTGEMVRKTEKSTQLGEATNALSLSSGTKIEKIYGDYSNSMKDLANSARLELRATKGRPYSPSANRAYADEVHTMKAKLDLAERNAPIERQAQLLGNATVAMKRKANPDMPADELKKIKAQALNEARARTGAGKTRIELTDKEWAAIQAGAISNHMLERILTNTDIERVKTLATPREPRVMTPSMSARARSMLNSGYDQAEVAQQLGISVSTLRSSLIG